MRKITFAILLALLTVFPFLPTLCAEEVGNVEVDFLEEMDELQELNSSETLDRAQDIQQWADSFAKQAERMAHRIQAQSSKMQGKMKDVQVQIEKMMPEIERTMHHSLALMEDIHIQIPEIPPIPHIPDMPKISHLSQIDENFKGKIQKSIESLNAEVQPGTPLRVDTIFSSVRIEPGESDTQILATVTKTTGADTKERAAEIMKLFRVWLDKTPDAVEIHVQFNQENQSIKGRNTMMHCDLAIAVPAQTPISLRNSFGDVTIQNIQSDIQSENKFGNTVITGTRGTLNAVSEYGQLSIEDHNGDGKVRGQFGDVFVNKLNGGLTVETGYGKTRIFTERKDAKIDGKFSFGEAAINLPSDYSGRIEAFASFGEIKAPEKLTKKKKMFNESVEGEIGAGQGMVQVKNSYAPVEITLGKGLFEKLTDLSQTASEKIDRTRGNDKPNTVCEGMVLDAKTGQPIANAKIEAFYSNDPPYAETASNEDGEYEFKVWSEEHRIRASAPGYREKSNMVDTGFLQRKKKIRINFLLEPQ